MAVIYRTWRFVVASRPCECTPSSAVLKGHSFMHLRVVIGASTACIIANNTPELRVKSPTTLSTVDQSAGLISKEYTHFGS